MQCRSTKEDRSPAISIFVKSAHGMVEVMHHWDLSKATGSKTDCWLVHAVIARCVFGPKSHDVNAVTRERTERRYNESRFCTHGLKDIVSEENQLYKSRPMKKLLLDPIIKPLVFQQVLWNVLGYLKFVF